MKKLFLKSNILNPNNNIYLNQETIKSDINQSILDKLDLNNSFLQNKNNITMDNPKYYQPSLIKSPLELPKIQNQKKNIINSKLDVIKRIMISNSSTNIYSQNKFGLPNNHSLLKKDKTQNNLIKDEKNIKLSNQILNDNINENNNINLIKKIYRKDENSLFQKNMKNSNNNINNITNINIHIYSNDNQIKENVMQRNTANANKNKNNILSSRDLIGKQLNNLPMNNKKIFNRNNSTIETISNINNKYNLFGLNNINNQLFPRNNNSNIRIQKREKSGKKQKVPRGGHSSSVEGNRNTTLAIAGNIILNSNKINLANGNNRSISKENGNKYKSKNYNNSIPEINLTQIDAFNKNSEKQNLSISSRNRTLNEIMEEYEEINYNDDIENINSYNKFLINLKNGNNNFDYFLKLFQIHLDIELFLNSLNINSNNNNYNNKIKNEINSPKKDKMKLFVNNDNQHKLFYLLNNFFNILNEIYYKSQTKSKPNNDQTDFCYFTCSILNNTLKNCIKNQICLYSSILISLTQLAIYDFNLILKNYFLKIFKEISFCLYNIFDSFIKEELQKEYIYLINNNLKNSFFENYNKEIKKYKTKTIKNREILRLLINYIDKSVDSLKFYSSSNLKYSLIKPYGDSLNQLLFSFERKTLFQFIDIFINTILYGELELNKKKLFKQNEKNTDLNDSINKNNLNNFSGNLMVNNINEFPPFLPPINPKYKFTVVLDVDETMIHFFFTYINGMFFVRPYLLHFLNEINKYYEIITFTAGTKEYADNILNLLDINNKFIKYRLYRQHTTIIGCSIFKDLTKLGRDLNRIIIIDNLKDNFKLQPNNGLFIKTWTSDINDKQFYDLERILKDIVILDVKDVRPLIERINDEIKFNRNIINPYSNVDINKIMSTIIKA